MKVIITGATGGLGRSLAELLLTKEVSVVALGRNQEVGRALAEKGAMFLPGDLSDLPYLQRAFQGGDLVVHTAGLASPFGPWKAFHQANVAGTEMVLRAMAHQGISKLVHISTPSVYFSGKPRELVREDEPLPQQKSSYARSKLLADELILKATRERGLSAILLRPRAIFGAYDKTIVPRMLSVMRKGIFPLPGGGNALVDLTAVENVVHAIWLAIASPVHFPGEIVNISNGEPMSTRLFAAAVADAFGLQVTFLPLPMELMLGIAGIFEVTARLTGKSEPLLSRYSVQSIGTTQTLSIEKARQLLGYEPVISVQEALSRLARRSEGSGPS